jgi:hypothetical protein
MKSKTKIIIIIIINKNGRQTHPWDGRDPPPVGGGVLPTG